MGNISHITNSTDSFYIDSSSHSTGYNCNQILIICSICSNNLRGSSCSISSNVNVSDKMISSDSSGNNINIGISYCIKSIKSNNEYNSSTNYN